MGVITRNVLISLVIAGVVLALMGLLKWYGFQVERGFSHIHLGGPARVAGTDSHVTFGYGLSDGLVVIALGLVIVGAALWQLHRDSLRIVGIIAMVVAGAGAAVIANSGVTFSGDVCGVGEPLFRSGGISCVYKLGSHTYSQSSDGRVLPPLWIALGLGLATAAMAATLPVVERFFHHSDSNDETTDTTRTIDGALQW